MSIGLGVFLSTIVFGAIWQIDKHGLWRRTWRVAMWASIIALAAGGLLLMHWWWSSGAEMRAEKLRVEKIRSGGTEHYAGLTLGMTRNEVTYTKGKPDEVVDSGRDQHWLYSGSTRNTSNDVYVFWSQNGTVESIGCANGDSVDCYVISDVGIGSKESSIRQRLGRPQAEDAPDSDGMKSMTYGTTSSKFKFILVQGTATVILLNGRDSASFAAKPPTSKGRFDPGTAHPAEGR